MVITVYQVNSSVFRSSVKLVEKRIPVKKHGKRYRGSMRVTHSHWVYITQCVLTLASPDSPDLNTRVKVKGWKGLIKFLVYTSRTPNNSYSPATTMLLCYCVVQCVTGVLKQARAEWV